MKSKGKCSERIARFNGFQFCKNKAKYKFTHKETGKAFLVCGIHARLWQYSNSDSKYTKETL